MSRRLPPPIEPLDELAGYRVLLAALLCGCIVVGSWIWRDLTEPPFPHPCIQNIDR